MCVLYCYYLFLVNDGVFGTFRKTRKKHTHTPTLEYFQMLLSQYNDNKVCGFLNFKGLMFTFVLRDRVAVAYVEHVKMLTHSEPLIKYESLIFFVFCFFMGKNIF